MNKKIISIIAAFIILILPVVSLASPDMISNGVQSSVSYLMQIKNPETEYTTTSNQTYMISAVALADTTVTLYTYSPSTDLYTKMYGADGNPLEVKVGASGLYAQEIGLNQGSNKIMVRAQRDEGEVQIFYLEINVLGKGFLSKIKTFAQNLFN